MLVIITIIIITIPKIMSWRKLLSYKKRNSQRMTTKKNGFLFVCNFLVSACFCRIHTNFKRTRRLKTLELVYTLQLFIFQNKVDIVLQSSSKELLASPFLIRYVTRNIIPSCHFRGIKQPKFKKNSCIVQCKRKQRVQK